ncbi:MAG TPA: allophanate hydrolase, partial [Burkholderiales bacterium]|nr:allophanate hydrolase [Burkholderiales bacterium]
STDAWQVAQVLSAHDSSDPYTRVERELAPADSARRVRCGVPRAADRRFFGDGAAERAFEAALEAVEMLGAELIEIDYTPYTEAARLLYDGPWVAERLAAIKPFFRGFPDALDPVVHKIIAGADRYSAVDAFEGQYRLEALRRECAQTWTRMDVLMVPTSGTIYRLDEVAAEPVQTNSNLGHYTNFVNLLDLAAIAVPAAFREDGLPSGVTFIAPALQDATLAEFGARFHRAVATRLGATAFTLPDRSDTPENRGVDAVTLAVVGAHLTGMPLNHQLTSRGACHLETCSTAPHYRLYELPNTSPPKPGLAHAPDRPGAEIEVELWGMPVEGFGSFVAEVPPPLAIGTITLSDGREVKGFVCEPYALEAARDISAFGGWRNYIKDAG